MAANVPNVTKPTNNNNISFLCRTYIISKWVLHDNGHWANIDLSQLPWENKSYTWIGFQNFTAAWIAHYNWIYSLEVWHYHWLICTNMYKSTSAIMKSAMIRYFQYNILYNICKQEGKMKKYKKSKTIKLLLISIILIIKNDGNIAQLTKGSSHTALGWILISLNWFRANFNLCQFSVKWRIINQKLQALGTERD